MTYCTRELRERGVREHVLAWRRWRRSMHITQVEAAALTGLSWSTVHRFELGRHRSLRSTVERLLALMQQGAAPRIERRGRYPRRRAAA